MRRSVNIGDTVMFQGDECIVLEIRREAPDGRKIFVRDRYGSEFSISKDEIER
jgi:hypothetical protein